MSGWKTKGSFGQAASVISIKHSRISETTKDCVFDLIHYWLVFPVLWVSRLRRDLLIVILYFGLPIDSFCKWKGDFNPLREVVSNFQESGDRKFNFFFICSKRPLFWTVFKNDIQKFQRVFILAKIGKFEIGQNVPNLHNFYLTGFQCIFTTLVQDNEKLSWIHFFRSCVSSLGVALQLYFISNWTFFRL